MTSSLTLSDYTSLTSDGQDWACPRCTTINSTNNVNCQACTEGRNPHHGNTDNLKELVIEQEKWFSQAAPKVERSITDRFKTLLEGWTCPICSVHHRFDNSCTACGHSLDPVKPVKPPKQSQSLKSISFGNVFQSIRGSFFKKPVSASNLSTDSHLYPYPYPSSSVDKHRHTGLVLVSKDEHGITDETISLEQEGEDCFPHIQPRPTSIDSGTYTMSDITSQASHLEPSDSRYNSPISCTDLSKEAAWKCTVCSAFNRAVIGQVKCYVCNIGDAPRDIVPLLIQQKEYHQAIEVTNNEISTPQIVSPQPVHHDGPTNSSGQSTDRKRRPTVLLHLTEANNETKLHRRSSWGDDCTPSPAKNCTQLMECKRREETSRANENYDRIRQHCIRSKQHFVDPDFPPCDRSLYIDPRKPASQWEVARWRRPHEILDPFSDRKTPWSVLRNDPDPGDIAQGVLGNCWVLSALSVIASVPELVESILMTRDYSPAVGAYQVRLCKDGVWTTVIVDDSLPVFRNKELVFSKAHHKQLWVPLIEKAIAKLYGSYESLNSGRVLAGLSLLTGLPCEKVHLKKQSDGDEEVDEDLIWAQLLSFKQSGFPMGASCGGHNICKEDYYRVGLEPNHAYSILDVLTLDLERTVRLLRLRNPWAKVSWTGDWSDGDRVWSHYPRLREEKLPLGGEVGIFWIEMRDVYRYFCEIDVCQYRPEWRSTLMQSSLPSSAPNQHSLLSFHIPMNTEVNVCVYQEAPRGGSGDGHNLLDLAALVLRYPIAETTSSSIPLPVACSLVVGSQIQSIVSGSGFLEPGSYAVLPLAFNHWRPLEDIGTEERAAYVGGRVEERAASDRDCVVSVFSSRMISYDEHVMTRPGFLAESLFLLAANIKPKSQPYPGMYVYEVCLRHGCRIIMAFNQSQHLHFTVSCNARESANILCTRGALHTTDCIPPMHRQVLLVLTQMEPSEPYSIYMRIEFHQSTHNTSGTWGALHQPLLTPSIHELHSPRLC